MEAGSDSYQWVLEAVDTHELQLLRYAKRLLGDLDLARDAVQHAFVRLCEESQDRLDGRVAPWLYRVCRNKALDHLRRAGRERTLVDDAGDTTPHAPAQADHREPDPAASVERRDLASHVRDLLLLLPAPQRETIDLWCEGLTYREIAEITGRQEGHVRVLAHRGLSALRGHPLVRESLDASDPSENSRRERARS